jgi:hypothetical protein
MYLRCQYTSNSRCGVLLTPAMLFDVSLLAISEMAQLTGFESQAFYFVFFKHHLMLGWLFIFAIRDQVGGYFGSPQYPDPMRMQNEICTWDLVWISFCLNMVTPIRGFSVVCTIGTMILYDKYHHAGAVKRWSKPRAGI